MTEQPPDRIGSPRVDPPPRRSSSKPSPLVLGTSAMIERELARAGLPACDGDLPARIKNLVDEYLLACGLLEVVEQETDEDHLLAALGDDRRVTLSQLADIALDNGKPDEARGWRWLATNNRAPNRSQDGRYYWHHNTAGRVEIQCIIPINLLHSINDSRLGFATAGEAYLAIVEVIASDKVNAWGY